MIGEHGKKWAKAMLTSKGTIWAMLLYSKGYQRYAQKNTNKALRQTDMEKQAERQT